LPKWLKFYRQMAARGGRSKFDALRDRRFEQSRDRVAEALLNYGPETPAPPALAVEQSIAQPYPSSEDISGAAAGSSPGVQSPQGPTISGGFAWLAEIAARPARTTFYEWDEMTQEEIWAKRAAELKQIIEAGQREKRPANELLPYIKEAFELSSAVAKTEEKRIKERAALDRETRKLATWLNTEEDRAFVGRSPIAATSSQTAPMTQGARYLIGPQGVDATSQLYTRALQELREKGATWNGIDMPCTSPNAIRSIGDSWRRGDRFFFFGDWHTGGTEQVLALARVFQDRWKDIKLADVQMWTAPAMEPVNLSLGPTASSIDQRRLCVECSKPAFTHRYAPDNTNIYGQSGTWECLQRELPESRMPQYTQEQQEWAYGSPMYSRIRISRAEMEQAARDQEARQAAAKPAAAEPPAVLKPTKRSYDDEA
jgi:hypothetical protein